jgi:unsaturated rhamnogalacturonyl hydrolase
MRKFILPFFLLISVQHNFAQTWVDSLDTYAREEFMPPSKFNWTWMKASLLYTMVKQYDNNTDAVHQKIYLDFVKTAMDKTYKHANGKVPNAVASGLGMAFLYRVTKDIKYKKACDKIYSDYLKIKRTKDGAVSHLPAHRELWDDTVFMIGQFLMELYKATGDEQYLNELFKQISLHREKLQDSTTGLWVHGWDSDHKGHFSFGSQLNWANKTTGKSAEIWGRGNGWVVVTMADLLLSMPKSNPNWNELAGYLKEMIVNLPQLQDKATGHWFQLTARPDEPENYIESSSTAMFAYGISKAIQLGLVTDAAYKNSIDLVYHGLRKYSIIQIDEKYITTKNVCKGTCIGDKAYYLKRKVKNEKPYSIGMFINFGRSYNKLL